MNRELKTVTLFSDINNNNVYKYFNEIRKHNDSLTIELHKQGVTDDFLLKHVIGVKYYGNKYMYISGSIAKHFSCLTPAYIYSLFKTHKLSLQQLVSFPITHFPVWLLQSADYIRTSRITAFLEYILNPISKQFCQFQFNVYCQDGKQYFFELTSWKEKISSSSHLIKNEMHIVAADVKALYFNVPRHLALNAIRKALTLFTNYNSLCINIFLQLIDHFWKNVILQFENHFYKQRTGIVIGNNHSVSIANITLHSILLPIAETIKQSQLFKCFIVDIIWLSIGKATTQNIQKAVNNVFKSACLKLDFRHICTQ